MYIKSEKDANKNPNNVRDSPNKVKKSGGMC